MMSSTAFRFSISSVRAGPRKMPPVRIPRFMNWWRPSIRLSRTVMWWKRAMFWKVRAIPRWVTWSGFIPVTLRSSK